MTLLAGVEAPGPGPGSAEPTRQYQASASAVFGAGNRHLGYVIVAEDITDQLARENDLRARNREVLEMSDRLRRSQQELVQREKMVALGTMAAGIAHEVGNPLAGLSAMVQLLRRRLRDEDAQGYLKTLEQQIDRIANIVRQTLEFCRPAASQLIPTDLDDLIEQTVKMVRYSHRARAARIESVVHGRLPLVRVVPQQVQEILINLLLNALDAQKGLPGDPVTRIERAEEDGPDGRPWAAVRVKDQGRGMTPGEIRHAFEPFFTTKPPGRGTGLGLAICYRLVEVQGGRIQIDSTPGRGTTVSVSFRGKENPAAARRTESTSNIQDRTSNVEHAGETNV